SAAVCPPPTKNCSLNSISTRISSVVHLLGTSGS
ncbi:MAG: hypothetical protein ACI88C_000459, partial [Acidimicrobiales bacterium]